MELVLKINRMNPAEYFASLGVLELLSQQDSDLLTHFVGDGNLVNFCVASAKSIALPDLRQFKVTALPHSEVGIAPARIGALELNWWLDVYREESVGVLKLWSGTTTPTAMLTNYQSLLQGEFTPNALNVKVETKVKSCFNFDIRASRDPLATGYSRNDAKQEASLYPFCEVLTAIGLQNFRPTCTKKTLQYFTWGRSIMTGIAHAACKMNVAGLQSEGFEVNFTKIGQLKEVSSVVSMPQQRKGDYL